MVEKGCRDDRAEREEREGGRTGFQGAAGSRSTQTDAVEQRWLEKKEQCLCVLGEGGAGG